ncbi:GTP-binding protein [bacterium]|nr:GTP-binding protein [bacterium]
MARIERTIIGIFGRINAGKSTAMNLLTQQETSLVDAQPGTTADIRSALMEIHAIGPCKLLDTAGLDEESQLGEKKRRKTLDAIEEVDLAVLVIDPVQALASEHLAVEDSVATLARKLGRPLCVVFNRHHDDDRRLAPTGATIAQARRFCLSVLPDPAGTPVLDLDLSDAGRSTGFATFLAEAAGKTAEQTPLLPTVTRHGVVVLHIPMDEETPSGRLLRPQEMAMEALLRAGVPVGMYRVDLGLARSGNEAVVAQQRRGFLDFLGSFEASGGVQLVITDSQAIDIMDPWVPREIPLTTFSIMMVNQTACGDMSVFLEGTRALDGLKAGDRVLVAEACNHDRIAEDIGTVQLPRKLASVVPGLHFDHAFGREFPDPEELRQYAVAIHCGGCMIRPQKLSARVTRLHEAGIPVTNYGLALSWYEGQATLGRVLEPWVGAGIGG